MRSNNGTKNVLHFDRIMSKNSEITLMKGDCLYSFVFSLRTDNPFICYCQPSQAYQRYSKSMYVCKPLYEIIYNAPL